MGNEGWELAEPGESRAYDDGEMDVWCVYGEMDVWCVSER